MTSIYHPSKQFPSGRKSYYYESEHISLFHNGLPNVNPYNEKMPFKNSCFFCFIVPSAYEMFCVGLNTLDAVKLHRRFL